MNAGSSIPTLERGKNVIRHRDQSCPVQVLPLREIVLVAVLAAKIAKIGDVPLNIEWIFRRDLREPVHDSY
jgi:hypothetical protein